MLLLGFLAVCVYPPATQKSHLPSPNTFSICPSYAFSKLTLHEKKHCISNLGATLDFKNMLFDVRKLMNKANGSIKIFTWLKVDVETTSPL